MHLVKPFIPFATVVRLLCRQPFRRDVALSSMKPSMHEPRYSDVRWYGALIWLIIKPLNSNLGWESSLPVNVLLLPRLSASRAAWLVWTQKKQEMSSLNLNFSIQRSAKVFVRGCEKFVSALAYLFCLALVGSCLAIFTYFLADLCTSLLIIHIAIRGFWIKISLKL